MERKLLFLHTKLLQFDLTISSTHSNYPRSLLSRRRVSALTALARLRTPYVTRAAVCKSVELLASLGHHQSSLCSAGGCPVTQESRGLWVGTQGTWVGLGRSQEGRLTANVAGINTFGNFEI